MSLFAKAVYNCNLDDAITAFLEKLRNGEATLKEINQFLTTIQNYEFREEFSELLDKLKSKTKDVKLVLIEKLQNKKQELMNATVKIINCLTTLYQVYLLQYIWDEAKKTDIIIDKHHARIEKIETEIKELEEDVSKLSNALSKYEKEEDEERKARLDDYICKKSASLRDSYTIIKGNLDKLETKLNTTIGDLRCRRKAAGFDCGLNAVAGGTQSFNCYSLVQSGCRGSAIASGILAVVSIGKAICDGILIVETSKEIEVLEQLFDRLHESEKKLEEFYESIKKTGYVGIKEVEKEFDL